jgi:hypothetical protein
MNKIKEILKSQRGQGVWEYMVILVGIGAVAYAVSVGLKSGLVGNITEGGKPGTDTTTGQVVDKIETIIDKAAGNPNTGGTGAETNPQ